MSRDSCFIRSYQQIPDIEEQITQNNIKIIPLKRNQKRPQGNDYYNKTYTLKKLKNHTGNLGMCIGYNHETNGKSIAVIDIDGYTKPNPENKQEADYIKHKTAEYIYQCLKDIPGALIVKTQSGGKHLYFWNETVKDNLHETSKNLHFPNDFEIEELRGESLGHSIEIFTKWQSKQCVLPGSTIKKDDETNIKKYEVISDIHNFCDISVTHDIHELVKKTLINKGFTYHKPKPETYSDPTDDRPSKLIKLNENKINEIVTLLTPYFKALIGMKNHSYLFLGGYLCNYVDSKSTEEIVKGLLKSTNDNYPKHIKTALSNYTREGYKKGLPSLFKNIQEACPYITNDDLDKLKLEINKLINPNYRQIILINHISKNKKKYLAIDYNKNEISTYIWNRRKNDEDEGFNIYYTDIHTIMNMSPKDIYESYNILDKQAVPNLCLTFYRKGMPYKQTIEGSDITSIEKQLEKRPGIILKPREYRGLLNEIIKEYIRLDMIHTVTDIPVPGIFINPRDGGLLRADNKGNIEIKKPSKEDLIKGLEVWNKLYNLYKGDKTKLSHIIRWGLLSPFNFIYKTKSEWKRLLFLYGASQTSKTTLAEIALSPYTEIDDDVSIGGSSADTEYRLGNALSRQGNGVIINEPGNVIETKTALLDLIKRAVENEYCREKQVDGVHTKIPAYSNIIFTSNSFMPTADAFVRRAEFIEFTSNERMSEEDKKEFRKTFNHLNWKKTDFKLLRPIGDFITWYVSENMDLIRCPHNVFIDECLNALFKYTGVNDMGWLYKDTVLMDITESDATIIDFFRSMVLRDYRNLTKPSTYNSSGSADSLNPPGQESLNNMGKIEQEHELREYKFKNNFLKYVLEDMIPYLFVKYDGDGNEFIGVRGNVGNYLESYCRVQVTCKGLADYFGCDYKAIKPYGKQKPVKGFVMEYDDFRELLI